jgi:hypothetical protein
MKCKKCGTTITAADSHQHAGETVCDECYMDLMAAPKACDPWAVYSAKRTMERQPTLTPLQEQMLALVRSRGPLSAEEICQELRITGEEFQSNFVTLRHMELAKGRKKGDQVYYTFFSDGA